MERPIEVRTRIGTADILAPGIDGEGGPMFRAFIAREFESRGHKQTYSVTGP